MSKAWQAPIPCVTKLVLLALCDYADDASECFPSVAVLASRCSIAERTAQEHLAALIDHGYLSRHDRAGRSTLFTLHLPPQLAHPRRLRTPAVGAPPPPQLAHPRRLRTPADCAPTPAVGAPPTPADCAPITTIEPSSNLIPNTRAQGGDRRSTIAASIFKVNDVDPDVWQDFVTLRKAKHAPLTKTAVDGLRREAEKAGWSLEDVVRECCGRGWVGFKAAWVQSGAQPGASAAQSFKAQDDEAARARWEAMTGQTHPDNVPRLALVGNVIDASSQFARIAL